MGSRTFAYTNIVALVMFVLAQNAEALVTQLDAVTIVAKRYESSNFKAPSMVSNIETDNENYAQAAESYEDYLRYEPGIDFDGSPRHNGIEPNIRGFGTESIVKTIDGIRNNFYSQHDGSIFIDPNFIRRIEVLRGPGAHLYGSGGIGGIIAFTTPEAIDYLQSNRKFGSRIISGYSSVNNERFLTGMQFGMVNNDAVDYIIGVGVRSSNNIRLSNDSILAADDKILSGLLKVGYSTDNDARMSLEYLGYHDSSKEPNNPQISEVMAELSGSKALQSLAQLVDKNISNNQIALKYQYNPSHQQLIDLKSAIYYQNTAIGKQEITTNGVDPLGTKKRRSMYSYGFNVQNHSSINNVHLSHAVVSGVELHHDAQRGRKNGAAYNMVPNGSVDYYSVFMQDDISWPVGWLLEHKEQKQSFDAATKNIMGKIVFTPKVRIDGYKVSSNNHGSNTNAKVLPGAALAYYPNDKFMLFGNWAMAFRAPNVTELYTDGEHFKVGPYINNFVPNPTLKPEKSKTYEVGAGYSIGELLFSRDNLAIKGAYFITNIDQLIDQQVNGYNIGTGVCPFPGASVLCSAGTTTWVNVANARIKGGELVFEYTWDIFSVTWNYSRAKGENRLTGASVARAIPHTLNTILSITPSDKVEVGIASKYARRQSFANSTLNRAGYGVHSLFWSYQLQQNLHFGTQINNIFDKKYQRTYANVFEKGRDFKLQLKVSW